MIHEIYYERDELFDVNMIITFRIDITGRPTYDKVEQAFYKAIGINEILLTKVNIEADGRAFYSDNDESGSWIRLVDEDLKNIRQREEKKRFLIEKGEYLRVFVRENSGDTSILFMMHHLAGDGKSLLYFIEDFMTFLSGGTKEYKKIRTVETKENIDAISQGIVRYYNKKWSGKAFDFDDLDQAYQSYWSNKSSEIETRIIEEKELKDILNNCREARVKFTAYLTAILISEEKNEMRIGYAVDYRHDNNRSMGNQASGISIKYKYVPSKSLTENAKRIQNKLDKKLKEHENGSYVLSFVGGIKPTLRDAVNLEHVGYFHNKVSYRLAKLMGYVGKTKDYSITSEDVLNGKRKLGEEDARKYLHAFVDEEISIYPHLTLEDEAKLFKNTDTFEPDIEKESAITGELLRHLDNVRKDVNLPLIANMTKLLVIASESRAELHEAVYKETIDTLVDTILNLIFERG